METKKFNLGTSDESRLIKIFRIIFGSACIIVAIFWLYFSIKTLKSAGTLWITIIFLSGFGFYQIWTGLGRATRFIEISQDNIQLKVNAILAPVRILAGNIERVEIFPLNVIFFLKTRKKILLRFGTDYSEIIEKILDEIIDFSEVNNIPFEIIEEKL